MKKHLARVLRRTADRIDPAGCNPIVSMEASWSRRRLPKINLELIGGDRMHGEVHPELADLKWVCIRAASRDSLARYQLQMDGRPIYQMDVNTYGEPVNAEKIA